MIEKLRNRITFNTKTSVSDGAGGFVNTLVPYYTCWAEMKHKLNTLLAATIFIAVGLACGNSKSEQSAATPVASESIPAITISSEKLVADYKFFYPVS